MHPYLALAANSPIDPGLPLSNITVSESDGNSSYNALWVTAEKRFAKGLQFIVSESWSKSIDDNSRNYQGIVIQNSYDIAGDRGLSDFNTKSRITISGIYSCRSRATGLRRGGSFRWSKHPDRKSAELPHFNAAFTGQALLRPNVTGPVIQASARLPTGARLPSSTLIIRRFS